MTARLPCPVAPGPLEDYAARFDDLFSALGQRRGFREYLAGLLLPRERNKTLTCLAGPDHLNHYVREHWSVENSEHYVRDQTFHEDDCRARTGQLPHVLATLCNLAIGAFRQHGHVNLAHARRHYTNIPHRLLDLFAL